MSQVSAQHCSRCRTPIRGAAPRCPSCGQRTAPTAVAGAASAGTSSPATSPVPSAKPVSDAAQTPTRDGFKNYVLDTLQRQILAAAAQEGRVAPIYVLAPESGGEGEVKAGDQRLFGNDAVAAVIGLNSEGLVAETDEACFELTVDGQRVGVFLQNPLRRASAEIWVPAASE